MHHGCEAERFEADGGTIKKEFAGQLPGMAAEVSAFLNAGADRQTGEGREFFEKDVALTGNVGPIEKARQIEPNANENAGTTSA